MRNVVLHRPMSLDGCVGRDGERSGVAIPEGDEVTQRELQRVRSAGAHLTFVQWPDRHPTGMTSSDLADPGRNR